MATKTKAQRQTAKELKLLEEEIEQVYLTAQEELSVKWNNYMKRAEKRLATKQQAYESALAKGDKELVKSTKTALDNAKRNITFEDRRYRAMVDDITSRLAHKNQIALDYINGRLPNVYRYNYNEVSVMCNKIGIDFTMVNEQTVANMIKRGDVKLPKKKVSIPKDKRWNTKQINSQVLQGIVQGEDMNKIAKRLEPIVDNNKVAAMRNARTITGGVQNQGRIDSYKKLEKDGVVGKKVWLAGADGRTRDWHIDMDGQEKGLDEPFIDGLGNKLDYPKDPSAPPETVYNCRCDADYKPIGFKNDDGSITLIDYDKVNTETLHDRQIKAERMRREYKKNERAY